MAVALGMDAMSVCMGIGVRWHGRGQRIRLATHMGGLQFAMPILGWLIGEKLAGALHSVGAYLAAALVFGIGVKMLWEAMRTHPGAVAEEEEHAVEKALHVHPKDPTRGWSLWVLSIATSIDALVVGFSLGLRGHEIWYTSVAIGIAAALMALAGVAVGKRMGRRFGRRAEILGAALLMGIGVSFLFV
jgi:putative Mn2+ efflux pump MntP